MVDDTTDRGSSVGKVRGDVVAKALEQLSTEGVSPEFIGELRGLLSAPRPPKADVFTALFEKHAKTQP